MTTYTLLAVAVAVAVAHAAGGLANKIGQPRVVGQAIAGIVLGPSALGQISPALQDKLFSPATVATLDVLAQFGVIFFMFLVGRELPITLLRTVRWRVLAFSSAVIIIPMALGIGLALGLAKTYRPDGISHEHFALFIGIALTTTALPVLASILSELRMNTTPIGVLGITTASVVDVVVWCLLALTVAFVGNDSLRSVGLTVGACVVFAVVMLVIVRPLLARVLAWLKRGDTVRRGTKHSAAAIIMVVTILLAAWATEWIGVHAIFGAFLAGIIMPRDGEDTNSFVEGIEGLTLWLMLPLFFVVVGLKVHLETLNSPRPWLVLLLIVVLAVVGKFVSSLVGRLIGNTWRESVGLGAMMNCRGLTELVVLSIGLSAGLITEELFSVLVGMALITTAMTAPLLRWALPAPHTVEKPVEDTVRKWPPLLPRSPRGSEGKTSEGYEPHTGRENRR